MTTIFSSDKKLVSKILGPSLMIIGGMGVIFMWISAYGLSPAEGDRDPYGIEKLILPFYFTHGSNVISALTGTAMTFNFIKSEKGLMRLRFGAFIQMAITLLIYGAVLFPAKHPEGAFRGLDNMTVHLITPLLAISGMGGHMYGEKSKGEKYVIWKEIFILTSFPITGLIIAFTIYFSLAPTYPYANGVTSPAAIYGFLDAYHSGSTTLIYISAISVVYIGSIILVFGLETKRNS